jgi:Mg2+ and Co2+ transporter CorA
MNTKNHPEYFEIIEGLSEELRTRLQTEFNADALDIEDVFTYTQLAKIENKKNYLYIALHFPEFDTLQRSFISKEVHCFLTKEKVLVIDKDNFTFLKDFETLHQDKFSS